MVGPVRPTMGQIPRLAVFLALVAGVVSAILIARDGGIAMKHLPATFLALILELYFFVLLLHVGIKSIAPSSWLPWK